MKIKMHKDFKELKPLVFQVICQFQGILAEVLSAALGKFWAIHAKVGLELGSSGGLFQSDHSRMLRIICTHLAATDSGDSRKKYICCISVTTKLSKWSIYRHVATSRKIPFYGKHLENPTFDHTLRSQKFSILGANIQSHEAAQYNWFKEQKINQEVGSDRSSTFLSL